MYAEKGMASIHTSMIVAIKRGSHVRKSYEGKGQYRLGNQTMLTTPAKNKTDIPLFLIYLDLLENYSRVLICCSSLLYLSNQISCFVMVVSHLHTSVFLNKTPLSLIRDFNSLALLFFCTSVIWWMFLAVKPFVWVVASTLVVQKSCA